MTIAQIIGLVVVLLLAILGGFFIIKKSKKNDLAKWLLLFIGLAIALTWIFEYGYYQGAEFYGTGMHQEGITDIPNLIYYAIGFSTDKIIFLLALGAFYGVLSKCEGYKKLVKRIAEKLEGKEILTILISSLLFTASASMFSQTFITLIFVPFMVSVLLSMKLDKITAFCATFGSILIGVLGATYGTEGLYWFNQYVTATITTGILYRLIVLVVAFILFNFFTVLHAKKVLKDKKLNELESDPFKVEKLDKKAKAWPVATLLIIMFIFIVLGYIAWEADFGITIFNTFHEKLIGLKIGEFSPFGTILGSLASAFGTWTEDIHIGSTILFVFSILIALVGRVGLNDYLEGAGEGIKKFLLPIGLFIGTYILMVAAYVSPFVPTITNFMFKNLSAFNPYLTALDALIANIFHGDFALTGLIVAPYFTTTFADKLPVIHTIFTTMYGFVGLCIPTSAILLIGLSYLKIDYKSWIKYIWMFVLAILVILLVLFTVMTYI